MRCPFCANVEDKVIDSRSSKDGAVIRRRRECLDCGERFTTYEQVENLSLSVVKSDGRREAFDREKLVKGLRIACTKRPISAARIDELVRRIEDDLNRDFTKEIPAKVIGERVMDALRALDEVAYVRFASVYRKFRDKTEFISELDGLLREKM
jgi:transcriptional repressor NrdR